ncbi:hypothetical protein COOONC_19366 [Cooperia oncophora]
MSHFLFNGQCGYLYHLALCSSLLLLRLFNRKKKPTIGTHIESSSDLTRTPNTPHTSSKNPRRPKLLSSAVERKSAKITNDVASVDTSVPPNATSGLDDIGNSTNPAVHANASGTPTVPDTTTDDFPTAIYIPFNDSNTSAIPPLITFTPTSFLPTPTTTSVDTGFASQQPTTAPTQPLLFSTSTSSAVPSSVASPGFQSSVTSSDFQSSETSPDLQSSPTTDSLTTEKITDCQYASNETGAREDTSWLPLRRVATALNPLISERVGAAANAWGASCLAAGVGSTPL